MSEASTKIYVYLLDEGTDVWRPVESERVSDGLYRLIGEPPNDTENWEFPTGSIVRVENRELSGGMALVAVALASD